MSDAASLARILVEQAAGAERYMVGIAGAPASGKSTFAEKLHEDLTQAGQTAVIVPMDGFHFDDVVLNARGHRARKGAPHTFDARGFIHLLGRIKAREPDIAIPVFDRSMELARAGASIVGAATKFILVEGNYLLLQQEPWQNLRAMFDLSVYLDVPQAELEQRLVKRWLDHGFDLDYATNWIASNDGPNISTVINQSGKADIVISNH
jgi:pantothenate kinase